MSEILDVLNSLRQSQHWPLYRAVMTCVVLSLPLVVVGMAVSRDELYAAVREAFRLADVSNTAAAINAGIGESLVSKKLRGEKLVTLDFLATQEPEQIRCLGYELIRRFGLPSFAVTAAQIVATVPAKGRAS